jgi:hypothetical protein
MPKYIHSDSTNEKTLNFNQGLLRMSLFVEGTIFLSLLKMGYTKNIVSVKTCLGQYLWNTLTFYTNKLCQFGQTNREREGKHSAETITQTESLNTNAIGIKTS